MRRLGYPAWVHRLTGLLMVAAIVAAAIRACMGGAL